jgi:excisionase family DNA binding protein
MATEILTIKDVASELKLAERTVYAMVTAGEIPGFKVRGQWRVRRAEFDRWLDAIAAPTSPEVIASGRKSGSAASASGRPASERVDPNTDPASPGLSLNALSERLPQIDLHRRFLAALGSGVKSHGDLNRKPLEVDLRPPLPTRIRVYLFNATRPPGGRPIGEHKVQLIMPSQKRGDRGSFDNGDGRIVFLVGYAAEEDVFILWDAGLYADFAWSRNVQVKAETIVEASAGKLATQIRILRPTHGHAQSEVVLATSPSRLAETLQRRVQVTRERMTQE